MQKIQQTQARTIRYDVFESRDGKAFIVWDRETRCRANKDLFRLELEAAVVVNQMNAIRTYELAGNVR